MYRLSPGRSLSALRPIASVLAPAGPRARLAILIYHRVLEQPDPLRPGEVDVAAFRWQMELLARHFRVLPLTEAVQRLASGHLPARAVCVTFDDGYADNVELALPVLTALGVPATFFIATGYLDGGRMWNDTVTEAVGRFPAGPVDLSDYGLGVCRLDPGIDRSLLIGRLLNALKYRASAEREQQAERLAALAVAPLPGNLMMGAHQVRTLRSAGMEVGAHTVTHPILARLEPVAARREIAASKARLEALLGEPIGLFAYPNGKPQQDYLPEHVEMVRRLGFQAAVSTHWGVATAATDGWQLPRFTPWDRTPVRFMARLLLNYRQAR